MKGLSDLQIVGGAELLADQQHMAAAQVHVDFGDADAVDQQGAFALDELDCVAGECLQVSGQAALGLAHQVGDVVVGAFGAADQPAVTGVHPAFVEANLGAVLDLLEDVGPGLVNEGDPVVDQHLGPHVRVAARDGRRGVDDGGDVGFYQRIGGNAVQIQDVEHHDVAGADPAQQSVDVPVHPCGAGEAGPGNVTGEKS